MKTHDIKGLLFRITKAITSDEKILEKMKSAEDDYERYYLALMIKDKSKLLEFLKGKPFEKEYYYCSVAGQGLSDDGIMELIESGIIQDLDVKAMMVSHLSSDELKAEFLKKHKGKISDDCEEMIMEQIKDRKLHALGRYYVESDSIGIESEEYREEVISTVTETLEECELFCRVYGKDFARIRMEMLEHVFLEKPVRNYEGFCVAGQNIIAVASHHGKKEFHTVLHESIHHILSRNNIIISETGILLSTGIGRGLNEGLTEWICEKAGYPKMKRSREDDYLDIKLDESFNPGRRSGGNDYYYDLTEFIKQIELAVGEENVMRLGMGDIETNMPNCLGMSKDDIIALLKQTDSFYSIGKKIREYEDIVRELGSEEDDKAKYQEMIDNLYEEKRRIRAEIETSIFERYFKEEFDAIKSRGYFRDGEYAKFSALRSVMQEYKEGLDDFPSISFQREYDELLRQQAKNKKISIGMFKSMVSRHDRVLIDEILGEDYSFTVHSALANSSNAEITTVKKVYAQNRGLQDLLVEVDGQVSGDKVIDSEAHITKDSHYRDIFVNTATDGYEQLIEEFCDIRDKALEDNPDTQIFIMNRTVVVGIGKDRKVYLIDSDNNHLVEAEEEEVVDVLVSKETEDDALAVERE